MRVEACNGAHGDVHGGNWLYKSESGLMYMSEGNAARIPDESLFLRVLINSTAYRELCYQPACSG